jgi:hypothetical protein
METTCEGVSRYVVYFTKGLADVVLSEVSALAPGITVGEPADRFAVVTADAASPGWLRSAGRTLDDIRLLVAGPPAVPDAAGFGQPCAQVAPTTSGRRATIDATPAHGDLVRQLFFGGLPDDLLAPLTMALEHIYDHIIIKRLARWSPGCPDSVSEFTADRNHPRLVCELAGQWHPEGNLTPGASSARLCQPRVRRPTGCRDRGDPGARFRLPALSPDHGGDRIGVMDGQRHRGASRSQAGGY